MAGNQNLRFTLETHGAKKILSMLNEENPIYGQPWKKGLEEAIDLALDKAIKRAPRATGHLQSKLVSRMQKREVPLWAKVPFPGILGKGYDRKGKRFRIAGGLEGGPMYHYRSGPLAGMRTQGWYGGVMDLVRGQIDGILSRVAREIEKRWG